MNFYSAYDHGFVRVAACTHHAAIGDPAANGDSVLRLARECHEDGVALAVFPELTLSGYSIEDILLQDALLDTVEDALLDIVASSVDLLPVLVVGAPVRYRNRVYNTAAVIHRGVLLLSLIHIFSAGSAGSRRRHRNQRCPGVGQGRGDR